MEKTYDAVVRIEFVFGFEAENREKAVEFIKELFKEQHDIELEDHEIIELQENE
jgi:hypothetical protein